MVHLGDISSVVLFGDVLVFVLVYIVCEYYVTELLL